MDKFTAIADPTRRSIIEMLADQGQLTASEIYDHFQISPQAISQHLKVLREANFVLVEKRAQQRLYSMNPDAMVEVEQWARQYREIWSRRFEALDKVLKAQKGKALTNRKEGNDGKNDD
ncbi:ArsR/SmtB family transcription factor [Cohnella lupini]|nr:metalloregulator ArsR/SmtB family transcription factor [Cohnella lupini]